MELSKPCDYLPEILRNFGKFPVAESLCKTLLTLPNYPSLSPPDIYRIGKIIRKVADQV